MHGENPEKIGKHVYAYWVLPSRGLRYRLISQLPVTYANNTNADHRLTLGHALFAL